MGADVDSGTRVSVQDASEGQSLYRAQVRLLYENLRPGLFVTCLNAAILSVIEWNVVSRARLLAWLGFMALVTAGRYVLVGRYQKQGPTADPVSWGRSYAAATATAGFGWGMAALLFFPVALLPQIFMFFMLTVMTTAAVVTFATIFRVALLFVIPTLAPLTLRLALLGGDVHHAMALVAVLFVTVMLLTAKRMEKTITASLSLRFENQDLISRLEKEKAAIHRLNGDLTREVAARTCMTEDLKEREGYLRAVLENVEEGIVTIDQQGALFSLNREALRIFGYREDELLGHHFSCLVPLAERAEYSRFLEGQVERPGSRMSGLGLQVNGLRADGTVFPMELGLSAMTVGRDRRFIAITRDISARKRTERLKSDLIATLSHELRTPLTSALGSLGLLAEAVGPKLSGENERLLAIARSNLDRLVRSVNEVLDVDHRQLIDIKFSPRPVSLTELLREAVAADADYAHGRHVRLAFDPYSSPVFVNGDKSLLLRALSHIVTNAIHLSPPHSTVELSVVNQGGQGIVSIRDCGTAVPIEARPCLFDASANLSSFGIVAPRGLCTARIIIEKHGGSVGYEPREAGGSHFFFRLPAFAKAAGSI